MTRTVCAIPSFPPFFLIDSGHLLEREPRIDDRENWIPVEQSGDWLVLLDAPGILLSLATASCIPGFWPVEECARPEPICPEPSWLEPSCRAALS